MPVLSICVKVYKKNKYTFCPQVPKDSPKNIKVDAFFCVFQYFQTQNN